VYLARIKKEKIVIGGIRIGFHLFLLHGQWTMDNGQWTMDIPPGSATKKKHHDHQLKSGRMDELRKLFSYAASIFY
jgi:hypothetical protein